jgi:hypothetical protein
MNPRTAHLILGGTIGAAGLALGYEIIRHRKALTQPVFAPPSERGEYDGKHKKHKQHDEHERGEYGGKHKGHKRHEEDHDEH